MGIEKQSSKSGNYVGGFLQLFDWNAKSRKKLFSSKSDFPEKSKQKKRCDGNLPTTRLQMMDEDEVAARPSMKGSSVYSCASSVTDEDSYGSKGPGVVARLMGLDPLPKSNVLDPETPFSYTHSLPGSYYQSQNLDYRQDPQIMQSSTLQQQACIQADTKPKHPKVKQRPIEKFQTEVLPPRSAKSIPITHHKLLSPIKSKISIPPKDAVHIMEAAARILDPGPKVSKKPVLPLAGSSLRVKDSKEKVQAAQKPFIKPSEASQRSRGVKHVRGSSMNKSSNSGSVDAMSVSSLQDSAEVTSGVKCNRKSISLALQAKANVQKREALSSTGSKACASQSEANVFGPNMFTSQSGTRKNALNKKPSTHKNSTVLRQNNQKQNCIVDRGKLPLKSNSPGGGRVGGDQSSARQQNSSKPLGTSKVSSRKSSLEVRDDKSNSSSCSSERVTRKKRSIEGKVMQSTDIMDTRISGGSDVISFTFTTPMRSTEFQENSKAFPVDSPSKRMMLNSDGMAASKFTFLGHNVKGGDSLTTFLELQLKELAHKVEFSHQKSTPVSLKSSSMLGDHKTRNGDYSFDPLGQPRSSLHTLRHFEAISGQKSISEDTTFLNHRLPSPVSVLEHSFFPESCNSSDSAGSNRCTEGGNKSLSLQSEDSLSRHSTNTFLSCEVDFDLSDSASSTSAGTVAQRRETTLTSSKYGKPSSWELDYVNKMLCGIEVMFKDYAMGRCSEIISPRLFDQLESCKKYFNSCELVSSPSRRLVFDCVTESLETRCRGYAAGGYELWAKGVSTMNRKERLAADVCREISKWSGMGDFMVDELVESDMSCSTYGKWLDYDVEVFELGVQIESRILNSLIDEVVADMLVL
ncbi:uncharacterized protein LOC131003137 [Salvia miltiorrhiza]|uniref:uncharacterized protein LOC131003137 n=1 Tax=Salvia miltiorrhiza TaxID=226208 RepID=UPI0025ABF984|nr:uncharacterized protein LOC131003137 [Salvia miltiorrhiza]XP_057785597.1 uncharacterized protein LOC131003137 [Salvia miltiorrhiza]XP_057785598.1 uncharacterized protein LOC131003137 [Salvia miltiorrhiza]XP_057785599.1 uncharacterized protein LOC131003137 [Salvia miltiorrhiza]XP_057785600.1 uncharacterized protein LOC131003137 [Salvia miltiorrhiza]